MQHRVNSPPDGGYGWVVVVSAFIVMGLTTAVLKTFGLFFVEIQKHFDELASTTSWITSVTIAMFHLGAPVASSLCARYTHRAVVIIGGLLAFSGMTLGSFGFNTIWMYTTTGFLQGLGISFSWTPAISIVSHYFSNRRALANAVASAGECAFAFTFGPFFSG
nr:monocarboxylate transporter 13-like isoform X2 [Caretta caretta]